MTVARRCFVRRPFILTNRSFRSQLVQLATLHGLAIAPEATPTDAGSSCEQLCPNCGQPHVVSPTTRLDGSLHVDARTFTVEALSKQLRRRFGCERLNIDYETASSTLDAAPPSRGALLPSAALMLPLEPFSFIALANLPVPIRAHEPQEGQEGPPAEGAGEADGEAGRLHPQAQVLNRPQAEPDALLTVFDTRRKSLLCLGVFDCRGRKGSALQLTMSLKT